MHRFRHGRVSQLQANGVPADFTKSQLGHSSLRTTSGYTHFTDAFKRETVECLAPKLMLCTNPLSCTQLQSHLSAYRMKWL
jgi:integrase